MTIFHAVPRPPGGWRGADRCAGRLSYHEARRLCRVCPPEGCPGSWRGRKMSGNAGGGGATVRMSDCHQMLVRRAEACEGGWFRAHWHVLGRCDMGWKFSHASRSVFTGMQNTVEVEIQPYFEGYRLCGVTRRTRPQTTNQLSPRGQQGCRAAPMRWFERRRVISVRMAGPTLSLGAGSVWKRSRRARGGAVTTLVVRIPLVMVETLPLGSLRGLGHVPEFSHAAEHTFDVEACGQFDPVRVRAEVGSAAALRADAAAPDRLDVPRGSLGPIRQRRMTSVYLRAAHDGSGQHVRDQGRAPPHPVRTVACRVSACRAHQRGVTSPWSPAVGSRPISSPGPS